MSSLPEWLDEQLWREFLEHRKAIRAPMTDVAQKRALTKLEKLTQEGSDPHEVLTQSIVNGWKGLFPVHGNLHEDTIETARAYAHEAPGLLFGAYRLIVLIKRHRSAST